MEREKALEMALGQIEKQFGKGAVMRMGENAKVKIASIPTGALSLDLALGIGGLPRGRVVEIFGPESSGKCITADTYVWTDCGLETVAELFERCGQQIDAAPRVTDVRDLGVRAVNERGELEQVAALTHNGVRAVLRIRLKSGRTISATPNHPLRVITEEGLVVWRPAGQVAAGDIVVSATFGAVEAAAGDGLSEDEAVLLGYLVAAGGPGRDRVRFTDPDDQVAAEFARLKEQLLGSTVAFTDGVHDAAGKALPRSIRTAGHKVQRAFLSALFEGDGWIDRSSVVGLDIASSQLAREVQLLLYGLGIPATVTATRDGEHEREAWTLIVNRSVTHRFLAEVGFRSARRQVQVDASDHACALAEAPYTYERVEAVEDAGLQPTFDLMLPETHSFIANGVLSHNTTVALHAVAEAQKAGGIAAFIDAEHALDPSYAAALGVDVEGLLVSQPDTGEQALEIADMLIRSGAIDIVVIDSVAALTPRAEIEGEMGDSHVGLQARLMSQALRKLAGTLNRSRTCAVFINQLREKIGVMFGSPETTPGGRALKFYSSVRLDVRRIESLKDGTDVVGNRVRVKVVKNKCLAAGTRVFDPSTGLTHPIEDIVEAGAGNSVWAADKQGRLHVRPIVARLNQGQQQVVTIALRDRTRLRVTPSHRILTEHGWREAHELRPGDRVARPRDVGRFGTAEPVAPVHARLMGYRIGDGDVGDKTPLAFIDAEASLQQDEIAMAECVAGTTNGAQKLVPAAFFAADVSADVLGNLLFGLFESKGWIRRERTGGARAGFAATSYQLAQQIHWLLLRWGITSTVAAQRSSWDVGISGIDSLRRFAQAIPTWGPRGVALEGLLADPALSQPGSPAAHLSSAVTEPVLAHLAEMAVTAVTAAAMIGDGDPRGGMRNVLGGSRVRRDRLERLAQALDSTFLRDILTDDLYYDPVVRISKPEWAATYDVGVEDLHNLVADDVVVHNCAPPFRQAEFDIMYGEGISREGSILDVGVDNGIIKKAGAWYTYDGEQLGQGRENARGFLKEHGDIAAEIYKKVTEQLGLVPTDVTGDEMDEPERERDA